MFWSVKILRCDWSVFGRFSLVGIKMWGELLRRFFSKFISKKVGAAAGWESLRVGVAAVRNVKE